MNENKNRRKAIFNRAAKGNFFWGEGAAIHTQASSGYHNAPINVNPVGGGGRVCGQGVGIWQILKFSDQIPQGGKRKVNQKCQKSPPPQGKNLDKQ